MAVLNIKAKTSANKDFLICILAKEDYSFLTPGLKLFCVKLAIIQIISFLLQVPPRCCLQHQL